MTKQTRRYLKEQKASLSLEQDRGKLLGLRASDGRADVTVKPSALLAAATLALSLVLIGTAQEAAPQNNKTGDQAQAAATKLPTVVERESWRMTIIHTPLPGKGCFVATYPENQWREMRCNPPSTKLYPPKRPGMIRTEIVGGSGTDFSAKLSTDHITEAEGSFDTVTGVTSECSVQCPQQVCPANPSCTGQPSNQYSLQLNSKTFNTQTCNGSNPVPTWTPSTCQGWEQFVYSSSNSGSIQYWLENYGPPGTACPNPRGAGCVAGFASTDGWCPFQFTPTDPVYCVVNGSNFAGAPGETISSLDPSSAGALKLRGTAAGFGGSTNDAVYVTEGATVYPATGNNYFPDLGNQWQEVEFNVFGDGGGDQAVFNSGSTLQVRTSVASNSWEIPTCDAQSFTGESNNLTLINLNPPVAHTGIPSLVFQESNAPGSTQTTCAGAVSVGDTHITTFDGLYYDFQASGDFVLAVDGPDFIVQARQASGAPTWPNAAVNKAIATQMGKTRVAVYIEPTRLVIDGATTNLDDGKTILLPSGVQIARQGNLYKISSLSGDRVAATLNSTWINVSVGLGFSPRPQVRGLLGNPLGNAQELATSKGVQLTAPVLFRDLYGSYAQSWRVPPKESLFAEETGSRFGIPTKPFYASDLTRQQAAKALAVCKTAGIKNPDFLDSCMIDVTMLNDKTAAKVFVHLPTPHHVITPGHRRPHHRDCDCEDDRDWNRDHDRDHDRD
ncbi:MAG TPA: VWD domain-containing protein [Candidatus Angelobacter sp.]|nr:VWD domain-containing protein [Candidatus Angelobacter sp.]